MFMDSDTIQQALKRVQSTIILVGDIVLEKGLSWTFSC